MKNTDDVEFKLRSFIECSHLGTWEWNVQTGEIVINETWAEIIGYSLDEFQPVSVKTWEQFTHPDDLQRSQQQLEHYFAGEVPFYDIDCRMKHKNGSWVWVHDRGKIISQTEDGRPLLMYGTHEDITVRKLHEEKLNQTQQLLRASIESPQGMIIMALDRDYTYLFFNSVHKAAMRFAYNVDVGIGMNILDCITSDSDRIKSKANYDLAMSGRSHSTIQVYGDKNKAYYESFYNPIYNNNKEVIGITAFAIDITERVQTQEALLQSEQKYSSLFNSMLEGFALHEIICDANNKPVDYRFLDMNPAFEKLTGLHKKDIIGKTVVSTLPVTEPVWIEKYGQVALTGEPISFENYSSALDRHYQVIAFCPKKYQFAVIFTDITDRKRADEAIASEKERLAVTLRSIGDGVITTDTLGNIVIINKVAEELTGWKAEDARGKPLSAVFNIINQITREPHENPVEKVLTTGDIIELANHTLLISKDGTERIIADSGAPIKDMESKTIGVVLVFRDMTEKHKMMDNLQRIDKLDALGVLAGGIAHDFNNLLGGIFGYIDMAKEKCASDPAASEYLDKAMTVFERTKDLTMQLLTFSKGGIPKRKTGDIGKLLKKNASFVLSGTNVSCNYNISDDLWMCDYDENQIGQVIDNIVLNAQQAMPDGGTITISTSNISLNNPGPLMLKAGNYIRVSITDTGTGIPQELLKRIFDPFFTTKQSGNGLGLATCYSIVEKHDGYIDVESFQGKGSTFHVYLPATHKEFIHDTSSTTLVHKGKGCILVMDDEDYMREIVSDMLISMGYQPIGVENGDQAVRLCTETIKNGICICGAIFDLTIPGGMGGKETIVNFRSLFPDIRVFASSGFSEDPIMARPKDYGFADSIRKPFKKSELAEMLNKHLGG